MRLKTSERILFWQESNVENESYRGLVRSNLIDDSNHVITSLCPQGELRCFGYHFPTFEEALFLWMRNEKRHEIRFIQDGHRFRPAAAVTQMALS
jgi:hypothetical protein